MDPKTFLGVKQQKPKGKQELRITVDSMGVLVEHDDRGHSTVGEGTMPDYGGEWRFQDVNRFEVKKKNVLHIVIDAPGKDRTYQYCTPDAKEIVEIVGFFNAQAELAAAGNANIDREDGGAGEGWETPFLYYGRIPPGVHAGQAFVLDIDGCSYEVVAPDGAEPNQLCPVDIPTGRHGWEADSYFWEKVPAGLVANDPTEIVIPGFAHPVPVIVPEGSVAGTPAPFYVPDDYIDQPAQEQEQDQEPGLGPETEVADDLIEYVNPMNRL